ncbi:hypothetical protein LJC33_00335 [Eubacteriales bacterium OttesenSCG-928-N13]|nr:hypothetical protein [Eubacteriales bacterium OttesenSCG-928-N13]
MSNKEKELHALFQAALAADWPSHLRTSASCRQCGEPLEAQYCEDRLYLVRCTKCGFVTLIKARKPLMAALGVRGWDLGG